MSKTTCPEIPHGNEMANGQTHHCLIKRLMF